AEALRRASGYPGDWSAYAHFDPKAGKQTADFDAAAFDRTMHELELSIETHDLETAWASAGDAERLLAASGVQESAAWAQVLDKQRWLSHELQRWDTNEAVCRAVVGRLGTAQLWAFLGSDDVVRHALRAAIYRLAMITLEAEPPASRDA